MHPVAFRKASERTAQPARVVAVIPARYPSTRFPGKPLADLGGRPMIQHVYERAALAPGVDAVIVATDDLRIARVVESFGGAVRMTRSTHPSGTDRIAEVAADLTCDIVVNVQGDLPLLEPEMIGQVVEPLAADPDLPMATLCRALADPGDLTNPNVVKVVADQHGNALYFSRSPVPFVRDGGDPPLRGIPQFKHIGMYGYRRRFLLEFTALAPTPLERAESLEQLRALEHGFRIRVVETTYESIEVDTPEDLERARQYFHTATPAGVGTQDRASANMRRNDAAS